MVPPSGWKNALTEATLTIGRRPLQHGRKGGARRRRAAKKFICIAHWNSSSLVPEETLKSQPDGAHVVHQHVDPAVLVERALHELRRPIRRGQIDRDGVDTDEGREALDGAGARNDVGPFRDERSVIARPMPLLAPVTTATLSVSSRSIGAPRPRPIPRWRAKIGARQQSLRRESNPSASPAACCACRGAQTSARSRSKVTPTIAARRA